MTGQKLGMAAIRSAQLTGFISVEIKSGRNRAVR